MPTTLPALRRYRGTASRPPAGDERPDGHPNGEGLLHRDLLAERAAWTMVWLSVLVGALALWESWWSWPVMAVLAPLLVAIAILGMVLCWRVHSPRSLLHQVAAMATAVVMTGASQITSLHTRIFYSTDSAALDHVAAQLLAAGKNPYTSSLAPARFLLQPPMDFWTYTVNGGHVTTMSYPAGSFLVYAPAFALGFHHLVVDWMDLYAWLGTCVLLFFLLPRSLRWMAGLVTLVGVFTGLFSSGGTDAAFLPFAMLAVWRWDRYGTGREAGVASWLGPVALGLACSIKQTPWFMVPFLVVGIAIETRRAGRSPVPVVLRYLAVTVGTFLAVNLPFIVLSPRQWWHDSLLPLTQPLVADGQGLVSLALHGVSRGANLGQLSDASALAFLATLVAFGVWYGGLKRLWLLLLPVGFFFAPRSFTDYLIDLFPVAVVGLLTVRPATPRPHPPRWRLGRLSYSVLAAAALGVGAASFSALALTSAPLQVSYVSADVGHQQQHLLAVVVRVTNTTATTVRPHFLVDINSTHPSGFWTTPRHRPVVLGPHDSAIVVLYPPEQTYLPPWATDYVVDAYIDNPESLSTSGDIWHNYVPTLTPAQQRETGTRGEVSSGR